MKNIEEESLLPRTDGIVVPGLKETLLLDECLAELQKYGKISLEYFKVTNSWAAQEMIWVEDLGTFIAIKSGFHSTPKLAANVCLEHVLKDLEEIKSGKKSAQKRMVA